MAEETEENGMQENNDQKTGSADGSLGDVIHLKGMYQDWFLDYASYVILERAVPHLNDGLKPVHRRILHSMRRMDDGRFNKVANIIGHTMQFHPHGDASIGDALVQLGQKDLLVETQGNWGNIHTGDSAAAPRYIEARLSKFAMEVVFNPKTTKWKLSYDGRNKEPVTLPVKFPLLLAQGVEGIAVGLASKMLPHNFNELIDASIKHLLGKSFELFPDFPTGGMIDVTRYNDGIRGGNVRVRAKINKVDSKTLCITDIPYGKTTTALIDSVIKANEKGKIKIKKIDDNTAENVEIFIHLAPNTNIDKTLDALYAFTDCEVSISPNSCVIENNKPKFPGVLEMLKISTNNTLELLKLELQIKLNELNEAWHKSSLEKIFIEERMYKKPGYENASSKDKALDFLAIEFKPFFSQFKREITRDDLAMLLEIKMGRILKYNTDKADELLKGIEAEIEEVKTHLANMVDFTINYFKNIKKKYGTGKERKTEIRNFETIVATKVVVANEKLYANRAEGFIGTGLKKDEYICDCSDIDEIIAIKRDGSYVITKVEEKTFVGKDIIHLAVFKKNDKRTIYNVVYRDGINGAAYMKRCAIASITRDKEYFLTKGTENSRILYLTINPNGEAEVINVFLKPRPRLRNTKLQVNFSELAIKGKNSMGNILTKYAVHKIQLKEKGESTLGGRKIWFDMEVRRINYEGRGDFLGEFYKEDRILVVTKSGKYRLSTFESTNHFEEDLLLVEKFKPKKLWTAIFYDADQKYYYIKRFVFDPVPNLNSFIGEHEKSKLVVFSSERFPQLEIAFGGKHKSRENEKVDADEFIAVKSIKAKGKRLTTYTVSKIKEIEPLEKEIPINEKADNNNEKGSNGKGDASDANFDDKDTNSSQMTLEW